MFHHQHGVGFDEAQWQHRICEQLVEFFCIIRFGHPDVVRLQVAVHREREQHDIKQTAFNEGQVEIFKAAAHVADMGRTHHTFTGQGSTDGRERFERGGVEFLAHLGRVLVDAFHQQQQVLGKWREDRR